MYSGFMTPQEQEAQRQQMAVQQNQAQQQLQLQLQMQMQQMASQTQNYNQSQYQAQMQGQPQLQYQHQYQAHHPKISSVMVIDKLKDYCFQMTKVPVSKLEKIEEYPDKIKHACLMGGISLLPKYMFTFSDGVSSYIEVPYYFCSYCGKLFIYKDFM